MADADPKDEVRDVHRPEGGAGGAGEKAYHRPPEAVNAAAPRRLTPNGVHPADFLLLPDGRPLLATGYRAGMGPFGVRALVGSADGAFDWEKHFVLVDDAPSIDCGYPSSVPLKDGRILTVYYGRSTNHPQWRVHCGAVSYRVPSEP